MKDLETIQEFDLLREIEKTLDHVYSIQKEFPWLTWRFSPVNSPFSNRNYMPVELAEFIEDFKMEEKKWFSRNKEPLSEGFILKNFPVLNELLIKLNTHYLLCKDLQRLSLYHQLEPVLQKSFNRNLLELDHELFMILKEMIRYELDANQKREDRIWADLRKSLKEIEECLCEGDLFRGKKKLERLKLDKGGDHP